MDESIAEIRT